MRVLASVEVINDVMLAMIDAAKAKEKKKGKELSAEKRRFKIRKTRTYH